MEVCNMLSIPWYRF